MKTILIVEDDPAIRNLLKKFLQNDCYVKVTDRGEEALRIYRDHKPDVIILDFELAGILQGDEVLREIRKENQQIPIISMSGRGNLRDKLLLEGADVFFQKPFDLSQIGQFLKVKGLFAPHEENGNVYG